MCRTPIQERYTAYTYKYYSTLSLHYNASGTRITYAVQTMLTPCTCTHAIICAFVWCSCCLWLCPGKMYYVTGSLVTIFIGLYLYKVLALQRTSCIPWLRMPGTHSNTFKYFRDTDCSQAVMLYLSWKTCTYK